MDTLYFDYSLEPTSDIAFIDMKSFYASVECVSRGLHPLTTSLCVMSHSDNSSGLILASSPIFKKVFGNKNVGRAYELPFHLESRTFNYQWAKKHNISITKRFISYIENWAKKTLIVPPRMDYYIAENMKIQSILENFAPPEDIMPYSIDEGFVDLTAALPYFYPRSTMSKKDTLNSLSYRIQQAIFNGTGIISTIGMSNSNPLLAKLALDNEAKHHYTMRANWSYEDVPTKVWNIPRMTDFWGIGKRLERRLNKLGIYSIRQLAQANPDILKKELGILGLQLFFHVHGIDESNVHIPYTAKSTSIGNSQVLPRDYTNAEEIRIVLLEMTEQVAVRLRKRRKKTSLISLYIGFSSSETRRSIHVQTKIPVTDYTSHLERAILSLFNTHYVGGSVRRLGVSCGHLEDPQYYMDSLFSFTEEDDKKESALQDAIDSIRHKFGFLSLQKGSSLLDGSRVRERVKLIGGHSAGGLDGLS